MHTKSKLIRQLKKETARYQELRDELIAIDWIKNKDAVDRVVQLLFESNKLLAQYRHA